METKETLFYFLLAYMSALALLTASNMYLSIGGVLKTLGALTLGAIISIVFRLWIKKIFKN